jgi:dimethylhistidine N-methyltransferase
VLPVEADFMSAVPLPPEVGHEPKLGFFPGSTIGNMVPQTAVNLLRAMKQALGVGAYLLIGMDRLKDTAELAAAYDDAQGITAAFNLNLLHRINAELNGTIPVDAFRHRAVWNDPMSRIEMHLEAVRDTEFTISGQSFSIPAGETIHTENSHKYGPRDARLLLRAAGWSPVKEWTDEEGRFALILAEAEAQRFGP